MKRLSGVLAVLLGSLSILCGLSYAAETAAGTPKPAAQSDVRIGYVDFNKVQLDSKAGKEAMKNVDSMFKAKQAELDQRQGELEKLLQELDKQSAVLKPDVRKQKEDKLQKEYKDLQRFKSDSEEELNKKKAEIAKGMYEEVTGILNKFGKEEGYTLILERSVVLYAPEAVDVTDKIIKAYDAVKK